MKGNNFMAFLGGALVGGALALLLAPKSGRETREQIRDFVEDEIDMAKGFVNKNVDRAKDMVHKGKEVVEKEIAVVKDAICDNEPAPRRSRG